MQQTDGCCLWHRYDEQPAPAGFAIFCDAGLQCKMSIPFIHALKHLLGSQNFVFITYILKGTKRVFGIQCLILEDFGYNEIFDVAIVISQTDLLSDQQMSERFSR